MRWTLSHKNKKKKKKAQHVKSFDAFSSSGQDLDLNENFKAHKRQFKKQDSRTCYPEDESVDVIRSEMGSRLSRSSGIYI